MSLCLEHCSGTAMLSNQSILHQRHDKARRFQTSKQRWEDKMLKHGQLTFISFFSQCFHFQKTLLSSVNFLQDKPAYLTVMLAFGISCKSTSQAFLCSTQSSIEESTSQPSHSQLTVSGTGRWVWVVWFAPLLLRSAQCNCWVSTQQCRSARFGRGGRLGVPGRCAAGPPFNCRDKKVASMASTLVLFFTQAVLMFGL